MATRFCVLGDVQVHSGNQVVELGHTLQRSVLGVLLIEANQVVPVEELADRIWAQSAPERARDTLYGYVHRLRRALAPATDARLAHRQGGYVLDVDPQAVDLHRFRHLVAQARATDDDRAALALWSQALGLWRGEPCAGLDTPWFTSCRAHLQRQRLSAELDSTDVQLRLGRHAELVAPLADRVAEHPLDERLAGQYLLALHRSGRQADALDHYRCVRRRLAEELGIDPGPALRLIHQQVLATDQGPGDARADDAEGATGALPLPPQPPPPPLPVPGQLPAAPRLCAGRERELRELDAALEAGHTVLAVGGVGGIGKTVLAVHWAHRRLDRFPDGQLCIDLRGFSPAGEPLDPFEAIRGFLEALGVVRTAQPCTPDAQLGLYRSLTVGKRMLIVLDNAAHAEQVAPLIPGSPTCTVLITHRQRLTGLVTQHGAYLLDLDVLSRTDSYALLAGHTGQQALRAEPDATAEILDICAGLPLALSIVAAQAVGRPGFPLAVLAKNLRHAHERLDFLESGAGDTHPRTVFSWSCTTLSAPAMTLFGLLGLAPGPDIGLPAVRSLAGAGRAQPSLQELEEARLVLQPLPGRYRMHDLVRLYAAERGLADIDAATREAALRRLVDFYVHTAGAGDRLLYPARPTVPFAAAADGCVPLPLATEEEALRWFDAEHNCLVAAHQFALAHRWHHAVSRLTWSLEPYHQRRGLTGLQVSLWRVCLSVADQLDDDDQVVGMAHRRLGQACARAGRHAEAMRHLSHALAHAERTEHLCGRAHTHHLLAEAYDRHGDVHEALRQSLLALELCRSLGNPCWEAHTLNLVGQLHMRHGDHDLARQHCEAALTLFRGVGDRTGQASTLASLGDLARRTGAPEQALAPYREALGLCRALGHASFEADVLDHLATAQAALGRPGEAALTWMAALARYRSQHRSADAARVAEQLAQCPAPRQRPPHRPS